MKFQMIDYDVWGNSSDGYDVNQAFYTNEFYELDENMPDSEIIKSLKLQGCIKKSCKNHLIDIGGDFDYALYFDYKGRPEFELRKVV